jgi:glutamate dehydrogenase/leucine dehydrogenase
MFRGDDFDADIRVRILHEGENHPTTRETLELFCQQSGIFCFHLIDKTF